MLVLEDLIKMEGEKPRPASIILVGVHGDERCGIDALDELLPNLNIETGTVWLGYGNPRAIEQNTRFTEANLNRMFKPDTDLSETDKASYEYKRAQFLKKYLNRADVLLDVHASFTPGTKPFVLCEENAREITQYLPFNFMVTGFDDVEPGGTDYYMNRQGRVGICAECGYLKDPHSTQRAKETILNFLKARNHIPGEVKTSQPKLICMYQLYLTLTDSFKLAKPFVDFEGVEEGQILGHDGDIEVRAPKRSIILFARSCDRIGEEAFLLGKEVNSPV